MKSQTKSKLSRRVDVTGTTYIPGSPQRDPNFKRRVTAGEPEFLYMGGYGSAATVTFTNRHLHPFANDIAHARNIWDKLADAGQQPTPETLLTEFKELGYLCGPRRFTMLVDRNGAFRKLRPRDAAARIFADDIFPGSSFKSISRLGRSFKRCKR